LRGGAGAALSEFVQRVTGRAAPPLAFLFCALVSAAIFLNYYVAHKFGNDFGVYWRAANQPADLVYFWKGRYPFPYAPTMLLWIAPLSLVPKWPAFFLFTALSVTAYVLACRPYLPKAAIVLSLISPAFVRGLFTGQVCAVMAALLLWACATSNRLAAGLALGVIASIKPQLVLMAPLMLAFNRDWRAFAAAGTSFLFILLLSFAVFGPDRWPEWISSMDHFHHAVSKMGLLTLGVTPAMIAERFGLPPLPFMILGTVAGAGLLYMCRSVDPLAKSAAIVIASLMAAPYALAYDLASVVPFLALAVLGGRIWSVLAITAIFHPIPLIVATWELLRLAVGGRVKKEADLCLGES